MKDKEISAGVFLGIGCGVIVLILAIICIPAKLAFEYSLWTLFGKDIHWVLDLVFGLILSEIIFFVWLVCFIVRLLGFEIPIF